MSLVEERKRGQAYKSKSIPHAADGGWVHFIKYIFSFLYTHFKFVHQTLDSTDIVLVDEGPKKESLAQGEREGRAYVECIDHGK
mgnify:CR=1 FL=1